MMQPQESNLIQILEHAAVFHGHSEVISRQVSDDSIHRYTYADAFTRATKCATALARLGVKQGDRIATMAWNTHRHLEAWYAIMGQGAICHTVNPRLFPKQIEYIMRHAQDCVLLVDTTFLPLVHELAPQLPDLKHIIILADQPDQAETTDEQWNAFDLIHSYGIKTWNYEQLLDAESQEFAWPKLASETPAGLCYTSGTTGQPKGVLYTHRSNFLHAAAVRDKSALAISMQDVAMMIVPMYHANSWGWAFACPQAGCKLVLPGAKLDGDSLLELLSEEHVSVSAGIPTIWRLVLDALEHSQHTLKHLNEITVGGAPLQRSLIEAFDELGVTAIHGWGMTEMSPVGTSGRLKYYMRDWPREDQIAQRLKQGPPIYGVSMRLTDDSGNSVAHDGASSGHLLVKGPWIVERYFGEDEDCVDGDGWFDTGDIATIDEHGYMQIVDRAKDLIKSGGEWISSVELESLASCHPAVDMVAAIGIADSHWGERPILVIQTNRDAQAPSEQSILELLRDRVPKWWLPDAIEFVDTMPLTATGKVSKLALREMFADYKLPAKN